MSAFVKEFARSSLDTITSASIWDVVEVHFEDLVF